MTLEALFKQGNVRVNMKVSPTSGLRRYYDNLVGATIIEIRKWMVTVLASDGKIAKIYLHKRGILERRYLMRSFEKFEESDLT